MIPSNTIQCKRENASEKIVDICIERTHTRIAKNERRIMQRQLLFFSEIPMSYLIEDIN